MSKVELIQKKKKKKKKNANDLKIF